jgi:hypothetical protein
MMSFDTCTLYYRPYSTKCLLPEWLWLDVLLPDRSHSTAHQIAIYLYGTCDSVVGLALAMNAFVQGSVRSPDPTRLQCHSLRFRLSVRRWKNCCCLLLLSYTKKSLVPSRYRP